MKYLCYIEHYILFSRASVVWNSYAQV